MGTHRIIYHVIVRVVSDRLIQNVQSNFYIRTSMSKLVTEYLLSRDYRNRQSQSRNKVTDIRVAIPMETKLPYILSIIMTQHKKIYQG